jgi:hypothetical protein
MPKQTDFQEDEPGKKPGGHDARKGKVRPGGAPDRPVFLQYAGLASQFIVAIGLGVWAGIKADHWMHLRVPVASWLLPLLILVGILLKLVRDTGTGK